MSLRCPFTPLFLGTRPPEKIWDELYSIEEQTVSGTGRIITRHSPMAEDERVPFLRKHNAMKEYSGRGGIYPYILSFCASLMLQLLYSLGKSLWYRRQVYNSLTVWQLLASLWRQWINVGENFLHKIHFSLQSVRPLPTQEA